MTVSYQLTGVPGLAVRAGYALQRWGAKSAIEPTGDLGLDTRRAELREQLRDSAARDAALGGMYRAPR